VNESLDSSKLPTAYIFGKQKRRVNAELAMKIRHRQQANFLLEVGLVSSRSRLFLVLVFGCSHYSVVLDLRKLLSLRVGIYEFMTRTETGIEPSY
jgi:hypothetical protein